MTTERLERVLFALKERIPTKLGKEMEGAKKRSSAKEKTIVDVYRGSDYQIAFFFRRTGKKHVVLLKDKHLAHPLPEPVAPQEGSKKRGREGSEMLDLTADAEEGSRPAKRQADDELIVVKDEEVEPVIPDWGAAQAAQEEDDYKPEYEDIKPELRVEYRGYSIFNKSLVVIVEPYPALAPSELAKGAPLVPVEVRQLSEMPSDSARPSASRGPSTSATPGPLRRGGPSLFRSDTTPLEEATPALDDDMRQLRESTEMLANRSDDEAEGEEELPSLKDLVSKNRIP